MVKQVMHHPCKRLAIFLPGLYGGGAERTMLNLAQGLANRGYTVDLVLARKVGPYLSDVPKSVRVVELNSRVYKISRTLAGIPSLVHYLKHEKPEVLLSALSYANIIALWSWLLAGKPNRIFINEQNMFSSWARQLPSWYHWVFYKLARYFYPWANGVITVSEGVAVDLFQTVMVARDRIHVIHNPIITPELQEKTQIPLEHPWFETGAPPVILAVGRLTAQKDFGTLIRAFALVRQTCLARLLILGEGEERAHLENLIKQLGLEQDIKLPGFVGNPYSYMIRASLFVLSSRWEGLPTVLVEALYCGVPLIATDCPSGPREILRDGQYGQLVPVGDTNILAHAIVQSLGNKKTIPPQESWKPYDLETVISQYICLLLGNKACEK